MEKSKNVATLNIIVNKETGAGMCQVIGTQENIEVALCALIENIAEKLNISPTELLSRTNERMLFANMIKDINPNSLAKIFNDFKDTFEDIAEILKNNEEEAE